MNSSRYILIVIALSFIVAYPYKAYTGEILFAAAYPFEPPSTDPELTIFCGDLWFRSSRTVHIPIGATGQVFYTAKETIFSPYGHWDCYTCLLSGSNTCTSIGNPPVAETSFTLRKGAGPVRLTMTKDSLVCTSPACGPASSQSLTAKATLGDDNNNKRRERDTWNFNGTGGDTILVTLEEDPESGHNGEEATLILRDWANNGSSAIEINTGALPIEIMATLPSDGKYELVVEQHGIAEDVRFRGDYYLSIESSTAEIEEITPTLDVEQ